MTPRTPLVPLLLLACAAPLAAQAPATPDASRPAAQAAAALDDLRLRPGDGLRIAVRDEPSLTGEFPVTQAGDALLPEIGIVHVAGRPFADVETEIRAKYARLLVDPQVVIVPLARVAVLGEVRRPGLFPVDPTQTIADVLASAGGLTPTGNPGKIMLLRDGDERRIRLDPDEPALGRALHSGDQILVAQRSWMRENMPVLVGAAASVLAAAVTTLIVR